MAPEFQHRVQRLLALFAIGFLVLIVWQSYWHLNKSDWLLAQETNKRLQRVERSIPRGVVYDRRGTKLAWTQNGKRQYADPRATAAVLGYMDPVYGRTGVEGEWDTELAGLSRRFTPQELHRILTGEKPRGNDLVLTLDLGLQQEALRALGDRRGAIALLDPATGAILALATNPTFDATTIRKDYPTLSTSTEGVLRNRAVQDHYPPGSTMKVVTASAALMHGVDPGTTYVCTGKTRYRGVTITDFHGMSHGRIAMAEALMRSCNNYFARTAAALPEKDFFATAGQFGFGERWWLKLPDSRMLPFQIASSSLTPEPTTSVPLGDLMQMGFGQSTVVATPLQMAMVTAAVANDGVLKAPYLVSELRKGATQDTLATYASVQIGQPLTAGVAHQVADMMRRVVTGGTGSGANVRGLTVYGKTGTAQQRGGEDHAWFIGFAEKGDTGKRLAFAVLVERGGTGGRVAVPIAAQVLRYWQEHP